MQPQLAAQLAVQLAAEVQLLKKMRSKKEEEIAILDRTAESLAERVAAAREKEGDESGQNRHGHKFVS